MTPKQIDKSISQMRQVFGFFGILTVLGVLSILLLEFNDLRRGVSSPLLVGFSIVWVVLDGAWAYCLWTAFGGLGKRSPQGYTFARICSVILLFVFPVFTLFGVSYLRKLSKPEMQQALGIRAKKQSRVSARRQSQKELPIWVMAVGIGILVVVAVVVLFTLQTPVTPALPTGGSSTAAPGRTKGDLSAKLELFDYSDFQ